MAATRQGFAAWLRAAIEERHEGRLGEAGREMGLNHSQLSRYRAGISRPDLASLRKIARWAKVELADLEAMLPPEKIDADALAEECVREISAGQALTVAAVLETIARRLRRNAGGQGTFNIGKENRSGAQLSGSRNGRRAAAAGVV